MVFSRKAILSILTVAAATSCFSAVSRADVVTIASDNAANAPYSTATGANGFIGLNGGTGFGAWTGSVVESGVVNPAPTSGGSFVSATNNEATNDTTTGAVGGPYRNAVPVFDVWDNGSPGTSTTLGSSVSTVVRPFNTAMTVGGTFAFTETLHATRAASGGVATSQVGFQLLDAAGDVLLDLHVNGSGPGYVVNDYSHIGAAGALTLASTDAAHSGAASRNLDINNTTTDTITIALIGTETMANGDVVGDYTITSTGHRGSVYADAGMQILLSSGGVSNGGPAAFAIYDNNGGGGSDLAVNNLIQTANVPEPATLGVGLVGVSLMAMRRRRAR